MLNLYKYHSNPKLLKQPELVKEADGLYIGDLHGKKIIISPKSTEKYLKFSEAIKYANSVNGWRLPSIEELGIISKNVRQTYHDERYVFADKAYWSSTIGSDTDTVWVKNLLTGMQIDYYADGKAMVRLIRK